MSRAFSIPKSFVRALLTCIYVLGFVITPYWFVPQSPIKTILFLGLILVVGVAWLYLSANSLQIQFDTKNFTVGILIIIAVIALNYRALNSVIPFKGDEVFHIERTLVVMTTIPLKWILVVFLLFIALIYFALRNSRWAVITGIFTVISVILFFIIREPFSEINHPLFLLRYPFINYWLFALLPKLTTLIVSPYHEILYRVIPVLSMGMLAWSFQMRTGIFRFPLNIAIALTVATIPSVFYYSSILYIEPPAIFLMTIVSFDIKRLLAEDSKTLTQNPGWYALILVGLIKETAIPFLLCFLACREIVQLWKYSKKDGFTHKTIVFGELAIILSVLAPAFLYVYFRNDLTSTRSYDPNLLNLIDPSIYPIIIRSLSEQFGIFLLFYLCGSILLIIKKEYLSFFFYTSLIVVTLIFFITDKKEFIGYSRFNLFVLPPILATANIFIRWVLFQKKTIGKLLILSIIPVNLLISPVYLDGTKMPYWGNYLIDTSEHYYPYQDALIWIKERYRGERVLFTGLDVQYSFQFYWNKLSWQPRRDGILTESTVEEATALTKILDDAKKENFGFVVYRVLGKDITQLTEVGEFQMQVIRNSAHTLIIYYNNP